MNKVFDISNSSFRPAHRPESLGNKENEIISAIKYNPKSKGYIFVNSIEKCDMIFTNDVFPPDVFEKYPDKIKVKRADGTFWQNSLKERNELYNFSVTNADLVIFTSQYSLSALQALYGLSPKRHKIVLNRVDDKLYFPKKYNSDSYIVSSCTNWLRPEKRLLDIMDLAELLPQKQFVLIGSFPRGMKYKKNITLKGYLTSRKDINDIFQQASCFVNFSFRDPSPKVVCQASSVHLPVIYADSGGTREMISSEKMAFRVKDKRQIDFMESTPPLNHVELQKASNVILDSEMLKDLQQEASKGFQYTYADMMKDYELIFAGNI